MCYLKNHIHDAGCCPDQKSDLNISTLCYSWLMIKNIFNKYHWEAKGIYWLINLKGQKSSGANQTSLSTKHRALCHSFLRTCPRTFGASSMQSFDFSQTTQQLVLKTTSFSDQQEIKRRAFNNPASYGSRPLCRPAARTKLLEAARLIAS